MRKEKNDEIFKEILCITIFDLVKYLEKFDYLHSGMSVIDFGSGTGHDAFQIAPLIAPGHITGIDVTPEMVDYAKKPLKS
ncbi:MAG: hypothetical protein HeimC3_26390 [Candidatus Heimdallarchaeota archaeon LC_3]|nr:MAG: hypothetical protein HeimC3_26390 [Candidatus Heimdallarchaeota archaeon LC_3]